MPAVCSGWCGGVSCADLCVSTQMTALRLRKSSDEGWLKVVISILNSADNERFGVEVGCNHFDRR